MFHDRNVCHEHLKTNQSPLRTFCFFRWMTVTPTEEHNFISLRGIAPLCHNFTEKSGYRKEKKMEVPYKKESSSLLLPANCATCRLKI